MSNILGTITDGFARCDRTWRIAFVNQQAADLLGKSRADLIGKSLWEVYPQTANSRFYQELHRAIAQHSPVHFQEFNPARNLWLEVHAYPIELGGITIYFQNITSRRESESVLRETWAELEHQGSENQSKFEQVNVLLNSRIAECRQAEESLRITNAQLATILESITDAFFAVDQHWRFTYVNQRAEQILQKNQTELLGRNLWEIYPHLVNSLFYRQCHEAIETKLPTDLEEFYAPLGLWLEAHIYPNQNGLSVYFRNITQRKQIEKIRNQSLKREQIARARAEQAEQSCSFLSRASVILAASLDYDTTLGQIAHLAVPFLADYCLIHRLEPDGQLRQVTAIYRDPQKQGLVSELASCYPSLLKNPNSVAAQVLQTREPLFVAEFSESVAQAITQDAKILAIYRQLAPKSAIIVPLTARGQSLGAITLMTAESNRRYTATDLALVVDLGRRAAMAIDNAELYKNAQESSRLKDEFLANLSHELRTPLNAISGWANLLRTQNLSEEVKQRAIETIDRNAKEQVRLIYDLLDVSRIVTGTLRLHPTWVELGSIIYAAIDTLRLAAEAKSIQIDVYLDPLVESVWGDRKYLRQVLWNLLSNAIKFTPNQGRVVIRLTASDHTAQIQISDTGRGISPGFLPHVFDHFRQADGTTTRHYDGLGLGLALVHHLVELHGGTVEVSSPGEGMGATFTVKLPIPSRRGTASALLSDAVTSDSSDSLYVPPLAGLQILVVEDQLDSREMLTTLLEGEGAEVFAVASVRDGLSAIDQVYPDLIISDIGLPEEDGYSLIAQVKRLSAEQGKEIPSIALTAYADDQEAARALAAGFQMYVFKPVDVAELVDAVAGVVNRSGESRFSDR